MNPEPHSLEARLAKLEASLASLEARLGRLERRASGAGPSPPETAVADDEIPAAARQAAEQTTLADLGRGFLILAGAFMLRALTDAALLPTAIGLALGLAYASLWIVKAGTTSRNRSASLFGIAAALVAFPLIWESANRFAVSGPVGTTLALAYTSTLALVAAVRARRRLLAWLFISGSLATSLILVVTLKAVAPYLFLILLLGLVTVWLGYSLKWHGLRWAAALAGDAGVLFMVFVASRSEGIPDSYSLLTPGLAQILAVSLLVVYLGSFVLRTLVRRRDVTMFEVLQSAAALFIGFGGAARISIAAGSGGRGLGLTALLSAAACYLIAFTFVDRRLGRGRNFIFFTSLALLLVFLGALLVLETAALILLWSLLALAAAYLGGRFDRITLRTHSAFYVAAAFLGAGCLRSCLGAFTGPVAEAGWIPRGGQVLAIGAALLAYLTLAITQRRLTRGEASRLPRLVVLLAVLIGLAGLAAGLVAPWLETWKLGEAARVAILSTAAVILAAGGRRPLILEFAWLVYPVLVLGGVKLLTVVFGAGDAATLFVSFTFYGGALIAAPRLLRSASWRTPGAEVEEA